MDSAVHTSAYYTDLKVVHLTKVLDGVTLQCISRDEKNDKDGIDGKFSHISFQDVHFVQQLFGIEGHT